MNRADPVLSNLTLQLPGVLGDEWSDSVGHTWRALVARPGIRCLDLDATEVRSVSARGLGLLAALHLLARQRGGVVRLRNCPPALAPLVTAARLDVNPALPTRDTPTSLAPETLAVSVGSEGGPAWAPRRVTSDGRRQ